MNAVVPDLLLSALLRGGCEHLPRVVDLSGSSGAYAPTIEPLGDETLDEWMLRGGVPSPGQAVTLAVAAVRATAAVHAAGVVDVRPDAASLRLRPGGCPVLCSFAEPRPLNDAGSTRRDWLAIAELLRRIGLHGVRRPGSRGIGGLASALAAVTAHETEASLAALEDALFATTMPEPVDFASAPHPTAVRTMPRLLPAVGAASGSASSLAVATASPVAAPLRADQPSKDRPSAGLAARLADGFEAGPHAALAPLHARLRSALAGRRRLVMIGAGIAAAASAALLTAVPSDGGGAVLPVAVTTSVPLPADSAGSAESAGPPVPSGPSESRAAPASAPGTADADAAAPGAEAGARDDRAAPAPDATAEDPVDAAGRLFAGFSASLVERDGGTALVALQPVGGSTAGPATALLIATAEGWRIRQVFEG